MPEKMAIKVPSNPMKLIVWAVIISFLIKSHLIALKLISY